MKPFLRSLLVWTAILAFSPSLFVGCGTNSSYKAPTTYTIGGTVTNLVSGSSVTLYDNGGDTLTVNGTASVSTPFTFPTAVASGGAYAVAVHTQPTSPVQNCQVTNGDGMASANVTNVTVNCAHGEWAWMSGANTVNQPGVYGMQNTAASTNVPGSRFGAVTWTDKSGNLWLFGGNGLDSAGAQGELNDLWKYSAGEWTYVSGSKTITPPSGTQTGPAGTYGIEGTAALGNVPGAREGGISWIDSSGNLWLFGGFGLDSAGVLGYMNDLWEYVISSGYWKWVSGSSTVTYNTATPPVQTGPAGSYSSIGTQGGTNVPGARWYGNGWIDSSGNLWLFGDRVSIRAVHLGI